MSSAKRNTNDPFPTVQFDENRRTKWSGFYCLSLVRNASSHASEKQKVLALIIGKRMERKVMTPVMTSIIAEGWGIHASYPLLSCFHPNQERSDQRDTVRVFRNSNHNVSLYKVCFQTGVWSLPWQPRIEKWTMPKSFRNTPWLPVSPFWRLSLSLSLVSLSCQRTMIDWTCCNCFSSPFA